MPPSPILVAQISDLHIKLPRQKAYGIVDTASALQKCITHLNAFRPRPDIVVISGDLVDTGTPAEYDHLLSLLAPLDLPFIAIPGNHDAREPMRSSFPDQPYAQAHGAMNIVTEAGDLDLVLLDSSVPGAPHGWLDDDTLAWLDDTLAGQTKRPALLFLHHPPFNIGIWHMDRQNLHNANALSKVLRCHPRVRLVAAGHVHRATLTMFANIPATICPAPNHAVALDLAKLREPSFTVEPPAFHLHAWCPGGDFGELVTYLVPIGDFAGPYPFFGADGKLL